MKKTTSLFSLSYLKRTKPKTAKGCIQLNMLFNLLFEIVIDDAYLAIKKSERVNNMFDIAFQLNGISSTFRTQ